MFCHQLDMRRWVVLFRKCAWMAAMLTVTGARAFTVNGDGTVTDPATNLVWDRCVLGRSGGGCSGGSLTSYTWANALAEVSVRNNANYLGYSDWRLPNKNELESLVDLTVASPAIDTTAFPNTPTTSVAWTATTFATSTGAAWVVTFASGGVDNVDKTQSRHVRLVRGGQTYASSDNQSGECGTAHATSPLATSAPSSGLCRRGTATVVTSGNSAYTWVCNKPSDGDGSNASCSASRGYTVTPSVGANGSISPSTAQVVAYNVTPTFVATPASGYGVNVWGGTCGGTAGGTGNVSYTTSGVTLDCSVSVSFVGNDSTPDAFAFSAANGVALSTQQTSNTITVAGITAGAGISVTGGDYQIGSGVWVTTSGTVNNGDTVKVRHTSSSSHSTATTTTLTIGGVSGSFTSTTAAPTPPPPPPPVVELGSRLSIASGGIDVFGSAVQGAELTVTGSVLLRLPGNAGHLFVRPVPGQPDAVIGFVRGPNGEPLPRPIRGGVIVRASAPGQLMFADLLASGSVVGRSGQCGDVQTELLLEVHPTTGRLHVTVLACPMPWPSGLLVRVGSVGPVGRSGARVDATAYMDTAAWKVFPGEYVRWDDIGQLIEMGLGSASGTLGLAGDTVSRLSVPGLTWMHTRPKLQGESTRLGGDVAQYVADWLGTHQQFTDYVSKGHNGLLIATQSGKRVVLGALGRVTVDPGVTQPDGWQIDGQGAYTLSLGNLRMVWAPALADAEGFARLLAAQGGTTLVQSDGTLLVTLFGTHFAAQAGEQIEPPVAGGGLQLTPEGVLTYIGPYFSYPQTLYPAAADFSGLRAAVLAADTNGSVLGLGQGRIRVVLGGKTYTLRPDMALSPLPAHHVGKVAWLEGQPLRLYLPVATLPGFAQGFSVE